MKRFLFLVCIALANPVWGQTYPDHAIRFVIPYLDPVRCLVLACHNPDDTCLGRRAAWRTERRAVEVMYGMVLFRPVE